LEGPVIVYLATYPRSGNDLLQAIIRRNLHWMTSQVSGETTSAEAFQAGLDIKGWEVAPAPAPPEGWPPELVWNEGVALCRFEGGPWRRMLLPGPAKRLDRATRTALAAEETIFFLKLHNLPFKDYLDGERVIQVVRHPGATLWSLFRYLIDTRLPATGPNLFKRQPLTLDALIEGDPLFGDWSQYHAAWLSCARGLGSRHLWLRYEDVTADIGKATDRVAAFLDQPVMSRDHLPFGVYRARRPGMDLRGTSRGYESFMTARQLVDLWERHGPLAEAFGYAAPDLSAAADNAQLRRLQAAIERAWLRGAATEREIREIEEQTRKVME
jgi:hypothetical protein